MAVRFKYGCIVSLSYIFLVNISLSCILSLVQVLEETGFDVSNLLNKDDYIEKIFGQQRVRLYIIPGVKDDTAFVPLTKKEISVCDSFLCSFCIA